MDYDAIVTQALALLQREQRLAYRVLKLRLQIDDDLLEALKDDLIYAKKLAVDEDSRVLVWTGGTSSAPTTTAPVPPLATPDISPTQVDVLPGVPPSPEAERRQLTVLFCDLVDSTQLSGQLDPEDLREVVRAYQDTCTKVIARFEGYIAQYLGDGLLVYFGYPQAHEDDAQRAIRTGLGILEAMGDLNKKLEQDQGVTLALRLGIHTGLVVVGEMGGAQRQEQLALGETPNIAARLQGLAAPNTLVISEATHRLVQGYFDCQALRAQTLRGVAEPIAVYRVFRESGARGRLDVAQPRGLTPLVGRESEVTLLLERWEQVKAGQGQVVLLTGDGGLGKSRLVQVLKDHVANEPHIRWECRSVPYYQHTALYPLTDLFQRILQWQPDEPPDEKLAKLEHALSQYRLPLAETVPLFAPLLALPVPEHRYRLLTLSPQRQRQKTLETITAILLELAERQPVLFIVEDLHWTDPTTLELLNLVLDQTPTAPMLVLLTCRPHFQPSWHHRSYITEMTLNHLSQAQVVQLVTGMTTGKTLPPEVLRQILAKTDGVPLFVEELTKAILESGQLTAVDGHYALTGALSTLAIPATLQDSLMARLDRLVTAKGVAQMGATIGRQFAYDLLQAVSQLDASTLQRELGRLVEAEIVYQRGLPPQATYVFRHALIQDAAAQSLLKSTRQQYHQRIAQVLEAQFPETAEAAPELLAHHYTEAGFIEQALPYWQRAGQHAIERSAYLEAIAHLTKGLEVLQTLPESPERLQQELALHLSLASALSIARGGRASSDVQQAYSRAYALCQQVGETPQRFQALRGLCLFAMTRGEHAQARELAEQLLRLAQRWRDPAFEVPARWTLGVALWWQGDGMAARDHLEAGLQLYAPQQHRDHVVLYGLDSGVACDVNLGLVLWALGSADQALQHLHRALARARDVAHPNTLQYALTLTAIGHHFRREARDVQAQAERAIALINEQGLASNFLAMATCLRGWALVAQGQREAGLAQMHQGLVVHQASGQEIQRPWLLGMQAEACARTGQLDEGLRLVTEALERAQQSGERGWEAELYRLQGELLVQAEGSVPQAAVTAEACFQQALDVARHQQAKALELRAAMSLARLWQRVGKHAEAYELLGPIYGWFTEGFDTADLQDAKALLEELVR
jgi:class 3 adenylate cyclase/predicted ATPase